MSLRPCSCLAALCVALLGASEAAAAPSWLELRWPEAVGCPTRAEVEATAGRLTAGSAPQPVTAEARIATDAAGYTLELQVRDAGAVQQRTLHSPRCAALADATAVIVAVAAAPVAIAARVVAAPPPAPSDPLEIDLGPTPSIAADPGEPAETSSASLAPAPARRRPGLALGIGAAAGIGPSQRFAAGLSGTFTLLWPRARLDLRGSGWFRSPLQHPEHPGVGAALRLAAGAVRGCPRLVRRALALELCGGLELGQLQAQGVGLVQNETTRNLWAAGLLAPGLQWRPLPWLALGLEVEAVVAFTRRRYATRDGGVFYSVPPVGVRLGGGIAVQFF
ncbi:hypothetical protein OV203_46190 [Nannocystis sp. ILAH1]|uniref:hypothetical protein n=1 Tax=Nannocystis sp. ILAH1 TaxID=2996789 RepID=UPI0022717CA6|nr:hypothetical protein [Nannocystis sp. ILAH1]MCY0994603.1 hypothetical protein [Nannocystis sp. ILAH1]